MGEAPVPPSPPAAVDGDYAIGDDILEGFAAARGEAQAGGRQPLGQRVDGHDPTRVEQRGAVVEGDEGGQHRGAGDLDFREEFGGAVLEGLEGADGDTELLAVLEVLDGPLERLGRR